MASGIGEGLWFCVPLRSSGFGLGIVARGNRNGVLLGYFFGPAYDEPPTLVAGGGVGAADAVYVSKFGHLGLKQGTWPRLGRKEDWNREDWPTLRFVRYEELTGRSFLVTYDETDPTGYLVRSKSQPASPSRHHRMGSRGQDLLSCG